jgi:hypothetical protein
MMNGSFAPMTETSRVPWRWLGAVVDRDAARVAAWIVLCQASMAAVGGRRRFVFFCLGVALVLLLPTLVPLLRSVGRRLLSAPARAARCSVTVYRAPAPRPDEDLTPAAPLAPKTTLSEHLQRLALLVASLHVAMHVCSLWARLVSYGTAPPGAPCANPSVQAWEDAVLRGWVISIVGAVLLAMVRPFVVPPWLSRFARAAALLFVCSFAFHASLRATGQEDTVAEFLRGGHDVH